MSSELLLDSESRGEHFGPQHRCKCANTKLWNPFSISNGKQFKLKARANYIGLFLLFILVLASSLFLVFKWQKFQERSQIHWSHQFPRELKLVSVFTRHGDRAPSDDLLEVDRHREAIKHFWPNGLHNLTDSGRQRLHKIGLALRYMYKYFIDYDSSQVLAFSSSKYRCIESLENMLRGFYSLDGSKEDGIKTIMEQNSDCQQCLPNGSGSPDEWKLIKLDTDTIPMLTERHISQCYYRKIHPNPLENDITRDPYIRALPGIERLEEVFLKRYGLKKLDGVATALYSTILCELRIVRTRETINYTDHYRDWIGELAVDGGQKGVNITLFDILEYAYYLKFRDQAIGTARWLEMSPIITSLIESQLMALNDGQSRLIDWSNISNSTRERMQIYENKRMIFYSSHDANLQSLLQTLELIGLDEELSYEQRYSNWMERGGDEFDKFVSGLSMSNYGTSIKFELWEAKSPTNSFPYVRVSLYNREEFQYSDIVYKPLRLGNACVRMFRKANPEAAEFELESFYNQQMFPIDRQLMCPFELFRNVTAQWMYDEEKYNKLC